MVRTRFAPSPTGYLHIGSVRTALFNWLFAHHHGGQYILRIDDTDRERNVAEALEPIFSGFRWLGLDWDEGPGIGGPHGPYYQSERIELYRSAAERLLDKGVAYWDYAADGELRAERLEAEQAKRPYRASRRWMAETPADRKRFEAEGRSSVVRLKMPREGRCVFGDLVRGTVEVAWTEEQDHVVQRADGSVLYNLANVVDDAAMRITHVIRAAEHLSNTPRQIFMLEGLGHARPEYAHVPFVAETGSRNKLSKRRIGEYLKNPEFRRVYQHGEAIARATGLEVAAETFNPVIVDFYRAVGYLPDALVNYLLLLGWALDDRTEFFSRETMVQVFSLDRIGKAPASFDLKKLFAFQDRYMRETPVAAKVSMTRPYLERAGFAASPEVLERVLAAAGDRIKVAGDILEYAEFFVGTESLSYDAAAFDKRLRAPGEAPGLLRKFRSGLAALEPFSAAAIEQRLQEFVQAEGIAHNQIIHALRVAVTGKAVGFGLFDSLAILGREACLARIDRALAQLDRPAPV
jgi:glutamyl-tRNA synthetase